MEYTRQIRAHARESLMRYLRDPNAADFILENYTRIEAPKVETTGDVEIRNMVMAAGGAGGGNSFKPGNLKFSLLDCCRVLVEGGLVLGGATISPVLLLGAAFLMVDDLRRISRIGLSENEATVAWAIFEATSSDDSVRESELHEAVNRSRNSLGLSAMSAQQVADSLAKLMRIGATCYSPQEPGAIQLCETITVKP